MSEHLFVYGSLCRLADATLHPLLGNDADYLCTAHLPGKLYEIDGYPGAIVLPRQTASIIHGELYRLKHPQALFQRLDAYEECAAQFPLPHEYRRITESVICADGTAIRAWLYVYNHSLAGRQLIQSGDYRRYQRQDYQP